MTRSFSGSDNAPNFALPEVKPPIAPDSRLKLLDWFDDSGGLRGRL